MGVAKWMPVALLLAWTVAVQAGPGFFDWCSITCPNEGGAGDDLASLMAAQSAPGKPTTMCAYPKGGGPQCPDQILGLSPDQKRYLLDIQNAMRNKVALGKETRGDGGAQPPAANMMKLEWDDEAEEVAQRWTEQCKEGPHDVCNAGRDGERMGQNTMIAYLAKKSGGQQVTGKFAFDTWDSVKGIMTGFYEEVDHIKPAYIDSLPGGRIGKKVIGHYTQLMWAKSNRVGCGMAVLQEKGIVQTRLVCNYKEWGNIPGDPIYSKGRPASQCPQNHSPSSKYPGLCESKSGPSEATRKLPERSSQELVLTPERSKGNVNVQQEYPTSSEELKRPKSFDEMHQSSQNAQPSSAPRTPYNPVGNPAPSAQSTPNYQQPSQSFGLPQSSFQKQGTISPQRSPYSPVETPTASSIRPSQSFRLPQSSYQNPARSLTQRQPFSPIETPSPSEQFAPTSTPSQTYNSAMDQAGSDSFDWCSITCPDARGGGFGSLFGGGGSSSGKPTTMCTYPKGGGPQCPRQTIGLTPDQKRYILDVHNEMRNKVALGKETRGGGQPPAANMIKLEWDDQAEEMAQRWAEQCKEGPHDECNAGRDGNKMGQNTLISFMSQKLGGRQVTGNIDVDSWDSVKSLMPGFYNEVDNVNPSYVDRFPGGRQGKIVIGHYTQLVWGKSDRVGCGMAIHQDKGVAQTRIVCNYRTWGNTREMPIYSKGRPATECPENYSQSSKYPGLCESKSGPSPSTRKLPAVSSQQLILTPAQSTDGVQIQSEYPTSSEEINRPKSFDDFKPSGQNVSPARTQRQPYSPVGTPTTSTQPAPTIRPSQSFRLPQSSWPQRQVPSSTQSPSYSPVERPSDNRQFGQTSPISQSPQNDAPAKAPLFRFPSWSSRPAAKSVDTAPVSEQPAPTSQAFQPSTLPQRQVPSWMQNYQPPRTATVPASTLPRSYSNTNGYSKPPQMFLQDPGRRLLLRPINPTTSYNPQGSMQPTPLVLFYRYQPNSGTV